MAFEYKKGDVVNVYFPNDNPNAPDQIKDRPCIILEIISPEFFSFICITGTDWRPNKKGIWIEKHTKNFNAMRLLKPSFIDLENIKNLPKNLIPNSEQFTY
jgi:hypothetical protein